MNIASINNITAKNNFRFNFNNSFNKPKLNTLNKDTVSFTSTPHSNKNIQNAVKFGYEIFEHQRKDKDFNIVQYLKSKEKDITILPMSELAKVKCDACNYSAFISSGMSEDFDYQNIKFYIDINSKDNSMTMKLVNSMEVAHEYTHLEQTKDKKNKEFYKNLCNNDREYLTLLTGIGDGIFSLFDTHTQSDFVSKTFNIVDILLIKQYGKAIPQPRNITEKDLLKANKMESKEEFNIYMLLLYETIFPKIIEMLLEENINVSEEVQEAFYSCINKGITLEKIKKDVKLYMSHSAENEQEAYTTESELARKAMKTKSNLNINAFVFYYKLLKDALK